MATPLKRGTANPNALVGLMARLGVLLGGRVRKLRAVEDQSVPIPEAITSELGGTIYIMGGDCSREHLGVDWTAFKKYNAPVL